MARCWISGKRFRSTAAVHRSGYVGRHYPRQGRTITLAIQKILLARPIAIALCAVGLVKSLLGAWIVRRRTFRIVRHTLMQLLFQLAFLQLIARLLLLRSLLELQAR